MLNAFKCPRPFGASGCQRLSAITLPEPFCCHHFTATEQLARGYSARITSVTWSSDSCGDALGCRAYCLTRFSIPALPRNGAYGRSKDHMFLCLLI